MRHPDLCMAVAIPSFSPYMAEQDSIRRLIGEAKAGSAHSFEQLVILHQRRVLSLAQRLLLNREAARDASQEVFLRVYQKLHTVDEQREFSSWLYRIVVNVCFDVLRRSKQTLPLDLVSNQRDNAPDPEQSAAAVQEKQVLQAALQTLSPRERAAVILADFEGLSAPEVAQILRVSPGTVRSQLSTGRCKLKNFVTAHLGRHS